ncbi:MAG: peptidoglycan DD-metalloendopeptidase family protein [Muribaculaceae bacterium]|nr:peptidoglycan DD-metalloendopeptidase family protein [Muribaculaceae bacterium]
MSKYCGRLLASTVLVAVMVAVFPAIDGMGTIVAQTKTATAKKKKGTSTGTQKRGGAVQNKAASNKKASSTQKKSTSAQKKNVSNQKKAAKTPSAPKSSVEAKRLQDAAQREIQQTKEKLRLNEEQVKTGLSDLNRLSSEIATGRTQVQGLQKKVASLNGEITHIGEEIAKNEAELKVMREEYLKAVKKMRLTKKNQSTLAFIFASENFNQAMRRIRYMRQFSEWKARKSADIDNKIKQLGSERTRLAQVKESQTIALGQLTKSQEQLEENHKKQEELVASLRRNGDALQAHLVAKQNEANRLKETISALIAQEQAKAEAERKAREKAEAERIAREKAEAARKAAEKAAAEKALADKAAAEKAAADKAKADKSKADKQAAEDKENADRKFAEAKTKAEEKARKEKEKIDNKKNKNSEKSSRKKQDRKAKSEDNIKENSNLADAAPTVTPKAVERSVSTSSSKIDFASLRGKLPRPVDGSWRITNPFGRHSMPELPEVVYDNPGIDAEVATGATVKSVCGGKVSGVYKVAGYGTVVIVNHGDYYTVYGNLSSANVTVGTQVGGGYSLGTAGSDPDDHRRGSVHFEVWKGREKQNPSTWLR